MGIKIVLTEDQAARLQAKVGTKLPINEFKVNLTCSYLDFDTLDSELGSKDKQKIGNNTFLHRIDDFTLGVKYHNTDIIRIDISNIVKLNTNGWETNTTKDRLNQFLRCRGMGIFQRKNVWYIQSKEAGTVPYVDGMSIHPDGHISSPVSRKKLDNKNIDTLDIDPKHRELYGLDRGEEV